MAKTNFESKRAWLAWLSILITACAMIAAFAWTADWIGSRPTSKTLLGKTSANFPPGFRRAHGKGMCFIGTFQGHKGAADLSKARVFTQPQVQVVGRFSIGAGNPHASDDSTKTVSMALLLATDDNQQWRMAMNNQPFFATRDAEGFLAMVKATAVDPATGRSDPERLSAFLKAYPEAEKFLSWGASAPSPGSFTGVEFYAANAFYFVDSQAKRHAVRWFMRPHDSFKALDEEMLTSARQDLLFDDLRARLDQKPLYWDLMLQVAKPGDPIDDASQPWPQEREQVLAGTLEIKQVVEQANGACRDINFDPSIVPEGIEVSSDPILSARSGAYSHSYNKRISEIGYGKATEAVGKPEVE